MNWSLLIPLLITTTVGIVGWFIAHALTKSRERQAEWRKEKLAYYKEYFSALAGVTGSHVSDEARKRYAIAYSTVGLFASQDVIKQLHTYQDKTRLDAGQVSLEEHDQLLTNLVLAVRKDIQLRPRDNEQTFSFHMIAARIGKHSSEYK